MNQTGCSRCDELKCKCPHCVTIDKLMDAFKKIKSLEAKIEEWKEYGVIVIKKIDELLALLKARQGD